MNYYLSVLKKYTVFTGRSRRKEYWMFFLFNLIFAIAIAVVAGMIHLRILSTLYSLAVLLPGIAVGIRRMHDTDRSGWWLLVPIANLIFAIQDGQPGDNRFGPSPKASVA
jgi:uncharacterized membrane protein YhaH (DUF805 family)